MRLTMFPYENQHGHGSISVLDAVETLNKIVEIDVNTPQMKGVLPQNDLLDTTHAEEILKKIRKSFRVILNYIRDCYEEHPGKEPNPQKLEAIKDMMVLVGEAAKKVDHFSILFQKTKYKSITQWREYKHLQEFYLTKISKKVDEGLLGRWILGLAQKDANRKKEMQLKQKIKHSFTDLEEIKKDYEYELLLIRKEDGFRYFNPRLIRNLKLVCDFGGHLNTEKKTDILVDMENWQDRIYLKSAKDLIQILKPSLNDFFHNILKFKERELVEMLNKSFIALLMCANPLHLKENKTEKCTLHYFIDFLDYFRSALHNHEYQKLIVYPPKDAISILLLKIIHQVCQALFLQMRGFQEIVNILEGLIDLSLEQISEEHKKEAEKLATIWSQLATNYIALKKNLESHPNGPLMKIIEVMETGENLYFDPIRQQNLPNRIFDIQLNEKRIKGIRMPIPFQQELINKPIVLEEFKGFLWSYSENQKHLLINLEDRTNWRETSRAKVIENLATNENFEKNLEVISLATESDFYHQNFPYAELNQSDHFINTFLKKIKEGIDFHFPERIKEELFDFSKKSMQAIHGLFFSSKNVMSRDQRLQFIDLFYLFLELKLLDMVKPESFSFTCKDGIDLGSSHNTLLFIFLKLLEKEQLGREDHEMANFLLFSPALFVRERVIFPERFNRLINTLRIIENKRGEIGSNPFCSMIRDYFNYLYPSGILQSKILG